MRLSFALLLATFAAAHHHKHAPRHYVVPAENTRLKVRAFQYKPRLRRYKVNRYIVDVPKTKTKTCVESRHEDCDDRIIDLALDDDFLFTALSLQPQPAAVVHRPSTNLVPIVVEPPDAMGVDATGRVIKWVPAEARPYFVPTQRGQSVPVKGLEGIVMKGVLDAAAKGRFDELLEPEFE